MRNIDTFVPKWEDFVIWRGGFSPEECDMIIQEGELSEFKKAGLGYGDNSHTNLAYRDTDIVWIEPKPETYWLFDRMNDICARINFDKFQMQIEKFDGFQYSKYTVDGHFDWHTDVIPEPRYNKHFRKITLILMLSDETDYEGGELEICTGGNFETAQSMKLKRGDIVAMYSFTPHKVAPVTKGNRMTLVTWALGEKLK